VLAVEPDFSALYHVLNRYERVALAVSGGADSTTLMLATAAWAKTHERLDDIFVLSVDHGLRIEAKAEAQAVCKQAVNLGMNGHVLEWEHDGVGSSLQEQARKARYQLLGHYCYEHNIEIVVTAHHQDDQVETMLMRLLHGSGIDGLGGMRAESEIYGVKIARPFLSLRRDELRAFLKNQNAEWIEDTSNTNQTFERVRVRTVVEQLEKAGLKTHGLARSAKRLARAQTALEIETDRLMRSAVMVFATGYASIDRRLFNMASDETAIRLLKRLVDWASGGGKTGDEWGAALSEIEHVYDELLEGGQIKKTLAGSVVVGRKKTILIGREYGRMDQSVVVCNGAWDGRFKIEKGAKVQAFGNLIDQDKRVRPDDLPYFVACCLPAIIKNGDNIYVPHLDEPQTEAGKRLNSLVKLPKGYVKHA